MSEKRNARKLLDNCLDVLRSQGEWDDIDKREAFLRARHAVEKRKPAAVPSEPQVDNGLQGYRKTLEAGKTLAANFDKCMSAAAPRSTERIREISSDPLFQETVIWQNRRLFHTVLNKCAERRAGDKTPNWKWRQREELVASYLQRYCVKNDTIGYFGPVGWATFSDLPGYVDALPGPALLASRQIYMEQRLDRSSGERPKRCFRVL